MTPERLLIMLLCLAAIITLMICEASKREALRWRGAAMQNSLLQQKPPDGGNGSAPASADAAESPSSTLAKKLLGRSP